jgi:hypothetical protein
VRGNAQPYRVEELRSQFPEQLGKRSLSAPSTLSLLNATHLRDRPYLPSSCHPKAAATEPFDEGQRSSSSSGLSTPSGIYFDPRGVHNYLPMPGTPYAAKKYDFTDPAFVTRQRHIRASYINGMKAVKSTIASMRQQGLDSELIARLVVKMRNDLKKMSREFMDIAEKAPLEERNRKKYGNPVGPNADQQYARYNSWETVIKRRLNRIEK